MRLTIFLLIALVTPAIAAEDFASETMICEAHRNFASTALRPTIVDPDGNVIVPPAQSAYQAEYNEYCTAMEARKSAALSAAINAKTVSDLDALKLLAPQ